MLARTAVSPSFGVLLTLLFVPACAPVDGALAADDTEVESDEIRAASMGHYRMRRDNRRCISPVCGGYWMRRVNHDTTRCADGAYRAECYVAETDWTGLNLGDRALPGFQERAIGGFAVLEGRLEAKTYASFGNLGRFVVTAGWQAANEAAPTGTFYRAQTNGIRCITYPCPTIDEERLNSTTRRTVSGVDLARIVGVTRHDIDKGNDYLGQAPGILVAGENRVVHNAGPAGNATVLVASQYYLRVSPGAPAATYCATSADCVGTTRDRPVTSASDCYCPGCTFTPLSASTASQYSSQWDRFCSASTRNRCPLYRCLVPAPPVCRDHVCVAAGASTN